MRLLLLLQTVGGFSKLHSVTVDVVNSFPLNFHM